RILGRALRHQSSPHVFRRQSDRAANAAPRRRLHHQHELHSLPPRPHPPPPPASPPTTPAKPPSSASRAHNHASTVRTTFASTRILPAPSGPNARSNSGTHPISKEK